MDGSFLLFHDVGFSHDTSAPDLFEGLSAAFPAGWTGIVGANGAGKTTLLLLASGLAVPARGRIEGPEGALYCPQRTDDPPAMLPDLAASADGAACSLRGRLGIGVDWPERWGSLSHGERKRAQIGVALWRNPPVLCIDEPTNHLDLPSVECLTEALRECACGLLLASHDLRFLSDLTTVRWEIREGEGGAALWI